MPLPFAKRRIHLVLSLAGLLALGACNSSSDSNEEPAPTPEPTPPAPSVPDPMAGYQWYLKNTGQDVLAGERPVAGVDLNMGTLYEDGVRGTGVVVAAVDDGMDVDHEDLAANADGPGSINFQQCSDIQDLNSCASAPLLDPKDPDNEHGTAVSGIIGMVGMNGKGGIGIAPEVTLKAFNALYDDNDDDGGDDGDDMDDDDDGIDEIATHLFILGDNNKRATDVDIFNMSYGSEEVALPDDSDDAAMESFERVMADARGGKGGLYIKAAGNEFLSSSSHRTLSCNTSHHYNVGCFDVATDAQSNLRGVVVAAAVNAAGQRSSYSSEGAPVWVAGFGGEYNWDPAYSEWTSEVTVQPALFSTDWGGCNVGEHRAGHEPRNAIDNGTESTIDPACNYTAGFNGTSAATPTVSGVTALILQTRPDFKARDVHYVLAKSARHPDNWKQAGALQHPPRATNGARIFDTGWHVNNKGVHFSRWFGYGLVDAQAAVEMAKSFTPLPKAVIVQEDSPDDFSVPIAYAQDKPVQPQESSIAVTVEDDIVVERVQVDFDTSHTSPERLLITLESPSGTRIPVIVPYTSLADTVSDFDAESISVNGFLDESARGEWRLYVEDMGAPYGTGTPPGDPELQSFDLLILGHAASAR